LGSKARVKRRHHSFNQQIRPNILKKKREKKAFRRAFLYVAASDVVSDIFTTGEAKRLITKPTESVRVHLFRRYVLLMFTTPLVVVVVMAVGRNGKV